MSEVKSSRASDAAAPNAENEPKSRVSMRERLIGVPADDDLMAKTDVDDFDFDVIGPNTELLSDITDEEDANAFRQTKQHTFYNWYKPIQPLVKNRRVRCFSFMNLLLFFINICLLTALLILIIFIVVLKTDIYSYEHYDKPCLYEWGPWSNCSKKCREMNDENPPYKSRTVNQDSIVQARGSYANTMPCPKNIEGLVDYAPCNTHLCPQNLSTFGFSGTEYLINKECYEIRDIPKADMQIRIDVSNLIRECTHSHRKAMF